MATGQAGVDSTVGSAQSRLTSGDEAWAHYSADDRPRHELLEADGQP